MLKIGDWVVVESGRCQGREGKVICCPTNGRSKLYTILPVDEKEMAFQAEMGHLRVEERVNE